MNTTRSYQLWWLSDSSSLILNESPLPSAWKLAFKRKVIRLKKLTQYFNLVPGKMTSTIPRLASRDIAKISAITAVRHYSTTVVYAGNVISVTTTVRTGPNQEDQTNRHVRLNLNPLTRTSSSKLKFWGNIPRLVLPVDKPRFQYQNCSEFLKY